MPSLLPARDVIDLDRARARRSALPIVSGEQVWVWTCAVCELSAGPFTGGEARHLARLHDQIQHLGSPTAALAVDQCELIAG